MNTFRKTFFGVFIFTVNIICVQVSLASSLISPQVCIDSLKHEAYNYRFFTFDPQGNFLGKNYTTLDNSYRTLLPTNVRDNALLLQALPSKDTKMLALIYITCTRTQNEVSHTNTYDTYFISVDTNSWKGKLITTGKTTDQSNIRIMRGGDGWIGATHFFIVTNIGFDPGAGGSCAIYKKTIFDMDSGKEVRTISRGDLYYDDLRKMVYTPTACEGPNKIFSVDMLTGKITLLKQSTTNSAYYVLDGIKHQNGKWILCYREFDSNEKKLELELP